MTAAAAQSALVAAGAAAGPDPTGAAPASLPAGGAGLGVGDRP
jgi:hypothetical protein